MIIDDTADHLELDHLERERVRRDHLAAEHRLLVHPDGSECLDGCDAAALWCRCDNRWTSYRHRTGWLVCGRCSRAVGGGS